MTSKKLKKTFTAAFLSGSILLQNFPALAAASDTTDWLKESPFRQDITTEKSTQTESVPSETETVSPETLSTFQTEAETEIPEEEAEKVSGETQQLTEAKIQLRITDPDNLRSGQLLVGDTIARNVQEQNAVRQEQKAVIEETEREIERVEEERRRQAEAEAARKAEEERRHAAAEAVRASSIISFSDQDYEVLKRIVEAEAGGCDMQGRILVANVILNRVRDSEFPSTITDVVYQRSQFSPVSDGRLNSCTVSEKTVEAVNRALSGEDYSQGALFFMNRIRSRSSNVSWFDGHLTYLFQHEKHEFFR